MVEGAINLILAAQMIIGELLPGDGDGDGPIVLRSLFIFNMWSYTSARVCRPIRSLGVGWGGARWMWSQSRGSAHFTGGWSFPPRVLQPYWSGAGLLQPRRSGLVADLAWGSRSC